MLLRIRRNLGKLECIWNAFREWKIDRELCPGYSLEQSGLRARVSSRALRAAGS